MKIIDRYILKSYLTRLVSVFTISMLIFVIQTFWLFIDELAGKDLDLMIIGKFLLYYSPKLVPLVLPLSVLISSLMTYGSFSENYEFAAMKSSGISLHRAMYALIIFHIILGIGSFYFSNHVIPYGELKSFNLRRNLAKLQPTLAIREGIFNDLGQMNIKVAKKYGENERFLEDVVIHENSPNKKNNVVIKAKRGELKSKTTDSNLQLVLFDGNRYEEIETKDLKRNQRFPHAKVSFDQYVMNIDLSKFNNIDLEAEDYTSHYRMQKVSQLKESIDTLDRDYTKGRRVFSENFNKKRAIALLPKGRLDTIPFDSLPENSLDFMKGSKNWKYNQAIQSAISKTKNSIRNLENKKRVFFLQQKQVNLHLITLYEKYSLTISCLLLFLIGAPLGAIIRKGGIGLPLVLAILIFLTYHYVGIFGKNAAEDNSVSPFFASWLSTIVYIPFAFFLTQRTTTDRGFINIEPLILAVQSSSNYFKAFVKKVKNKTNDNH